MDSSLSPDSVHLTVCATCIDTHCGGEAGLGGGAKLHAILETQLADHPYKGAIKILSQRCLMACAQGCAVTVASRGKMKYILGNLPADENMAAQILDFAALYSEAPTGVTPNHEWPGTIGMHFLGRIPPVDPVEGDWNDEGSNL